VGDYEIKKSVQEQLQVLFTLAIYTGFRKGEILALKWEDIDFDADRICVSRAVTLVDGKPVCKSPKTKTSHRTVSIPHSLTEQLRQLQRSQLDFQAQVGDYWQGENWVFIQDNGKMMGYSTPYQALQDIITRYNKDKSPDEQLPHIPFHGLRHTSATLLIAGRQDVKTVSQRLGHAQTSTTMNIYAHALQESDLKAADALEAMLNSEKSKENPDVVVK
jgi:integrase